jgi:site-specific DNA-methyltransferase (adenine-specific)
VTMTTSSLTAVFSHETTEWETPHDLFQTLNARYAFDLDVCATPENAKCETYYTRGDDGLARPWNGSVWCNPPYGRVVGQWLKKARVEIELNNASSVVFLLPARTDTKWFHEHIWDSVSHHPRTGVELQLLVGRLRFHGAKSSAPFPSMIAVLKRDNF